MAMPSGTVSTDQFSLGSTHRRPSAPKDSRHCGRMPQCRCKWSFIPSAARLRRRGLSITNTFRALSLSRNGLPSD